MSPLVKNMAKQVRVNTIRQLTNDKIKDTALQWKCLCYFWHQIDSIRAM